MVRWFVSSTFKENCLIQTLEEDLYHKKLTTLDEKQQDCEYICATLIQQLRNRYT